jgi:hypothetical protein
MAAVRWILDKVLRLAAAATALILMPVALLGGRAIDIPGTTLSLIAGLSVMFLGFATAFLLLGASLAFWPKKSPNSKGLKRSALIVVFIIYLVGTCGIVFGGATLWGVAYVKSHTHLAVRNQETK